MTDIVYFETYKETINEMSENRYARKVNPVVNRLFTIHDSSDPSHSGYVGSRRHPADAVSLGETSLRCHKAEMWLSGPDVFVETQPGIGLKCLETCLRHHMMTRR